MRWKTTWVLLTIAVLLFAFIYFVERKTSSTSVAAAPAPRLLSFKPESISGLQLERSMDRTNKFRLWLERTDRTWNLSLPLSYPAQAMAVENLLQALASLTVETYISPQELAGNQHSMADYGLDVPAASLTLRHGGSRTEILFGSKTSVGDHI